MANTRHGARARSRPHSFRARMVRILALSIVSVLVPLGFIMAGDVQGYRAAVDTARAATTVEDIQALIHELQKERGLTVGLLGGDARFRAELNGQRPLTDAALTTLRTQLDQGLLGGATVRAALADLDSLTDARASIDRGAMDGAGVLHYYTTAITALTTPDFGADSTADTALRSGLQALESLGDAKEYTGRERAVLSGVFAARRITPADYQLLLDDLAAQQAALGQFSRIATPAERDALAAARDSAAARQAASDESVAVASDGSALSRQVDPVAWFAEMTTYINSLRQVQIGIGADIDARATALRQAAERRLIAIGLLAALTLGFELWLARSALRSVVGPLARLSREAQALALHRLPEAVERLRSSTGDEPEPSATGAVAPEPITVPPYSGVEITEVAGALGLVQVAALNLATGQAILRRNTNDSLVNLARRNQNLVRRQLTFITRLERDEPDAEVLASLFELDHLATRMRRNAESLLVLVGEAAPRRWAQPVSVHDLIRAAMSEVEDYPRVALRRVDEAHLTGSVIAELAHLLAELIENGLHFSPPDVEVEILGRRTGPGYLIAVTDHGVGMTPAAQERANAKLRGEDQFDIAPTRFLGHYVVGRLAGRLGAQVVLADSPTGGVTARIELPSQLLATVPTSANPTPADPPRNPVTSDVSDDAQERQDAQAQATQNGNTVTSHGLPKRTTRTTASVPVSESESESVSATAASHWRPDHQDSAQQQRAVDEDRAPEAVGATLAAFSSGHSRGAGSADAAHASAQEDR